MLFTFFWLAALALTTSYAANVTVRPVVIWHGLGDSHSSPGMLEIASLIKEEYPGIFVHSIYIEEELDADRRAGFYGEINQQLEVVAEQLSSISELRYGFDAIGFSQGGQFLRAYVERYNSPPIQNLVTFGSQHMGISDIPLCSPRDFLCQIARRATKRAVYSPWAQSNLIQAQYFRDPRNMEGYRSSNHFLTSVNNELSGSRNSSYARNLASLSNLVLVLFTQDKTVVPKESAWFGSEAEPEPEYGKGAQKALADEETIVPMRLQPLYIEDWIGLRELDERGGVKLETCVGEHMQLNDCWKDLVRGYIGDAL